MIRVLSACVSILILLIFFSSCRSTGPAQSASTVISDGVFLPGVVLGSLPVYPGATPTTSVDSHYGPPSFPASQPIYTGPSRPGYQSASAQYTAQAAMGDILTWYAEELGREGYRKYHESVHGGKGSIGRTTAFFLPSQPLVSMEVHVYGVYGVPDPVFEILITYSVPLPKPPEEALPSDIDSVKVTYFGYLEGVLPRVKTLTDKQDVMQLVNMVNALPVRPDYATGGSTKGPETIFSLVFHSPSEGDITVTSILGGEETGVNIGDYPILEDTHNLLREAVKQVLGVQSTYPVE